MDSLLPDLEHKIEWICQEIPLLPNADIDQLRADISNARWPDEFRNPAPPSQSEIKKMLEGIKSSTDKHLLKIQNLYTVKVPHDPDDHIIEEFYPDSWLDPIIEQLEKTKAEVHAILENAPPRLKSGKIPDKSFENLSAKLIVIYEKYTGEKATAVSPSAGEPTYFMEFAKACFIALNREEDVTISFGDKLNKTLVAVRNRSL
jgi:hypothetical protein